MLSFRKELESLVEREGVWVVACELADIIATAITYLAHHD